MALLRLQTRRNASLRKLRNRTSDLSYHPCPKRSRPYRASGLVRWPDGACRIAKASNHQPKLPLGRCRADLFVETQAAVGALAETLDLLKRDRPNLAKPAAFALRLSHDGPIPECSETRRAARATDEAKQERAKEEHEHQARNSQHNNESAADYWCKQISRGAKADDIANARKPVASLVFRISKVLPQRHSRAFYDLRALGA